MINSHNPIDQDVHDFMVRLKSGEHFPYIEKQQRQIVCAIFAKPQADWTTQDIAAMVRAYEVHNDYEYMIKENEIRRRNQSLGFRMR